MRFHFLFIAVLVVATLSGTTAAQADNTTVEVNTNQSGDTCNTYITEHISLCSAEYNNGVATLVLDGDRRERITVTEAVALTEPREINRNSFIVDGRTEIQFAVSSSNGAAGVTIDDGDTLYGLPLESSSSFFGGPWGPSDSQAAGLGGSVAVALITLVMVFRARLGSTDEPERVA